METDGREKILEAHLLAKRGERRLAVEIVRDVLASPNDDGERMAALRTLVVFDSPRRAYQAAKELVAREPENPVNWGSLEVTARGCGFHRIEKNAKDMQMRLRLSAGRMSPP